MLQERRAALDPVTAGFPARGSGPGRKAVGLSQEQMDELLVRTHGTCNRFENGRLAHPGGEMIAFCTPDTADAPDARSAPDTPDASRTS
ncbi:helix-turn-helix domain-containing protein [Streptomyces sp. NPDC093089]|uniref:helix-turn-helix domain-containing protein n=1 Tax=Streptomyces sp. NPDC093089 TaxID=3366024 RepID=UPI003812708B